MKHGELAKILDMLEEFVYNIGTLSLQQLAWYLFTEATPLSITNTFYTWVTKLRLPNRNSLRSWRSRNSKES